MRYKLAIFDFDGTLADSFPWFLTVLNQLAQKYSFKESNPAEIEALRRMNNRDLIRYLGIPFWKMPFIANDVRRRSEKSGTQIKIFPEIQTVLKELHKKGVLLSVATSNSEANVRRILGPELNSLIHSYHCGASLFGKSRLLKKALRKNHMKPREAIYVGDEARDFEAASKAHIDFGFVSWGYAKEEAVNGLTKIIFKEPEEILGKF